MKKVLKVSLLIITIVITFSYLVKNILNNYKNNIDFDYNMRDYDIAITRKDINCITKVFYLKKIKY